MNRSCRQRLRGSVEISSNASTPPPGGLFATKPQALARRRVLGLESWHLPIKRNNEAIGYAKVLILLLRLTHGPGRLDLERSVKPAQAHRRFDRPARPGLDRGSVFGWRSRAHASRLPASSWLGSAGRSAPLALLLPLRRGSAAAGGLPKGICNPCVGGSDCALGHPLPVARRAACELSRLCTCQ